MIVLGPGLRLASGDGSDPTPPSASGILATTTVYTVTRDANGAPQAGQVVSYRLVYSSAPGTHDTTTHTVTSDSNGIAAWLGERGGVYQFWRVSYASRTVAIDAQTSDPFELPPVSAGE